MKNAKTIFEDKRLNSAKDIAIFIRDELEIIEPHYGEILRVITREIDRWAKNGVTPTELVWLTEDEWTTGHKKWDALLEGIVLHCFHKYGWSDIPYWCYRNELSEPWMSYEFVVKAPSSYLETFMFTPSDMLEKGLLFSSKSLDLL